jgi:FAD/FMN-containing dehydrogenase
MNKIIEVSDKFSYAVVEPGVTFGDLYNYCAEKKLRVWPSTASLGWGSVIGNVSSLRSAVYDNAKITHKRVDFGSRNGFHPHRRPP